jgi:hypothetical protein
MDSHNLTLALSVLFMALLGIISVLFAIYRVLTAILGELQTLIRSERDS